VLACATTDILVHESVKAILGVANLADAIFNESMLD